MNTLHVQYEISDDPTRVDFDRVHAWLITTYWAAGRSRDRIERSARNSALVVGAYLNDLQVGFLRVVSDRVTFAWIADVYVDEAHRKQGLAKAMVRFALAHPDFHELKQWVLGTRDAHAVYAECRFVPHPMKENFMQLRPAGPDGTPFT